MNLRQEERTKQTDGEKECKTGIQPKPMEKKCICAQVRETDIQMDRWNMLDRGRNQRAGKMVGFLSQKSAGKMFFKQLVIKFPQICTHALMF